MTLTTRATDTLNRVSALKNEGIHELDFDWNALLQIQHGNHIEINSQKYKYNELAEVFDEYYDLHIDDRPIHPSYEPSSLELGSIVNFCIMDVSKHETILSRDGVKERIICNTNLHQYPNFQSDAAGQYIRCKVISRTRDSVIVDPIAVLVDEWLAAHTTNLRDQYDMDCDNWIDVSRLRLIRGGYIGDVYIDTVSEFCGKDMYMEAFIPGSQIVLNIEYDFDRWVGQSVRAFITNYTNRPRSNDKILICSPKERLKHIGSVNIIRLFNSWCEDSDLWNSYKDKVFDGVVTGVIHSANKCGAFVEIPELSITSMIPCTPDKLSSTFIRGSKVQVCIDSFEEPRKWNGIQYEHLQPYDIRNGILYKNNIRVTLKVAE